jgi:polyhydroxybutyrate depolymerase
MDELADQETFVVAYPLGSKSVSATLFGHTWNGGKCCFSSADDFDYLKQVVEKTAELVTVDRSRVYSMGFSAGGVMSHTLACQAADIFAAVVSIDGPIEIKGDCSPSRPVPVMHFHGSLDLVFPYSGTPLYHGAPQTLKIWHDADQCSGESSTSELTSRIKVETYGDCGGAEVQLATVHNGGHAWPPKSSNPEQLIWNFLSQWTISKDETVAV